MPDGAKIKVGATAGWCFHGEGDMQVAKHCEANGRRGLYVVRVRFVGPSDDRRREIDKWFKWKE